MVAIFLFVLGAGVGSFISTLTHRVLIKQSIWRGFSRCDKCRHRLGGIELVPIIGWLFARGRCRHCGIKISIESLIVEIITAILFAASYLLWPNGTVLSLTFWLIIVSGFVCLALFDFKTKRLPNKIIYPILIVAAVFWLVSTILAGQLAEPGAWLELLLAMLPLAGVYGLIFLISHGKLVGLGDVKLGLIIGFLLPWQGAVAVLLLANLLALPFAIVPTHNKKHPKKIPLAPFLIIATIIVFLARDVILNLFQNPGLF